MYSRMLATRVCAPLFRIWFSAVSPFSVRNRAYKLKLFSLLKHLNLPHLNHYIWFVWSGTGYRFCMFNMGQGGHIWSLVQNRVSKF